MPEGWGRTPIIYLRSVDTEKGFTSVPERQDPWERGLALMGIDYPDGWGDLNKWEWYNYHVLRWWHIYGRAPQPVVRVRHKLPPPDVTTLSKVGVANPPRGAITRFYVGQKALHPTDSDPWFVIDMDKGETASGTRQSGYPDKEEAIAVAQDLADNRDRRYTRFPF